MSEQHGVHDDAEATIHYQGGDYVGITARMRSSVGPSLSDDIALMKDTLDCLLKREQARWEELNGD